jgi:hypothetical protein
MTTSSERLDISRPSGGGDDFTFVALDDKYLYAAWGDSRKTVGSSLPGAQRSVHFGRIALPKRRNAG